MKRPKTFSVGDVRLRVKRGPRDGAWYWVAERFRGTSKKHGVTVWTGWGTRSEASRAVAAVVAAGEDTTPQRKVQADTVGTVKDLLEFWLGQREDTAKASTLGSDRTCAKRLVQRIGGVHISRLNRDALQRYRVEALRDGLAPASVGLDLGKLRAAWNWAREVALVEDKDLRIPRFKKPPTRAKYTPSRAEVDAVLLALDGLRSPERERRPPRWVKPALLLLAETGARIGEVAALRWESIDSDRRLVHLDGKTGPRVVPVSAGMLLCLRGLGVSSADESVWPVTVVSFDRYLGRWLERACEAAEVPRWTPHGFRRFVATELLDKGVPIHTAQAITGHSPATMLRYYATATEAGMREALSHAGLTGLADSLASGDG